MVAKFCRLFSDGREGSESVKGKQYVSPAICVISSVLGGAVLLLVLLVASDFSLALVCGLGTSSLVASILPFYFWLLDRRYSDIEDDIPEEVLLKEQIGFSAPESGRGGYLCVTEQALYLFSRDRKPHLAMRLPREAMLSAEVSQKYCLRLSVLDRGTGQATVIALMTPKSDEILSLLAETGWIYGRE